MSYLMVLVRDDRRDLVRFAAANGEPEATRDELERELEGVRLDIVHLRRLWDNEYAARALDLRLERRLEPGPAGPWCRVSVRDALREVHDLLGLRGIVPVEECRGRPLERQQAREAELCWSCHRVIGAVHEAMSCPACGAWSEPYEPLVR